MLIFLNCPITSDVAADAALSDVHAVVGDKINGTSLQKRKSAFSVFL